VHEFKGAASLIDLHYKYMKKFLVTWREAKSKNIALPETSDPYYESLDSLLFHVLNSSRGYINWICRNLKLPDPEIKAVPPVENIQLLADEYLEYLLEKWKHPLKDVPELLFDQVFRSNWEVDYSIEAMLEHAVMHPVRHEYQLRNLIKKLVIL
jgi:uncharacterized damage-inducible protein DinB